MSLPLNGRIAIVENDLDEAIPLIKVFSKNQMPYVFYKGDDIDYLPEEDSRFNDIRLLFLDLNLFDKSKPPVKQVKSVLHGVLKRIISTNNYPYLIILWSKQENDYTKALKDLFNNELKDRAPISIVSFIKSEFFTLSGEDVENDLDLINEINKILIKHPAYRYLLNWENHTHVSTDLTLQEIFSSYHQYKDWSNQANYIVDKLGLSYSGSIYNEQSPLDKIRSSFNALSLVFSDTLETAINTKSIGDVQELLVEEPEMDTDTVFTINKKLLTSDEVNPIHYSGNVLEITNSKSNNDYDKLLDKILNKHNKKEEIKASWKRVWLNVTPLCDTVQGKIVFHRLIRGALVEAAFTRPKDKIFHQNEAIYISPSLQINDKKSYSLVLDFRHFFTLHTLGNSKYRKPIFRIRQQLLAEIQSRLARHVNRQGILFI